MNASRVLGLFAVTLLCACGPKDIDRAELDEVLFPSEGQIGGYDFGDSWAEIKANPNEVFEVRDDPDFKQLRRKLGDNAGSNGYFIGFSLDEAGKVQGISASINGKKQNAVAVRVLLDDLIARYDQEIGNGSCALIDASKDNSSSCSWSTPGKPEVGLFYIEGEDPIYGSLELSISPPSEG